MAGTYTAAGAAIGSVVPGVGTAVGAAVGAVGDLFMGGGNGGGAAGGFAPQDAQSAIYGGTGMDSSSWNVNFAGTQTNGANKSTPSVLESLTGGTGGAVAGIPTIYLLAGGGLLLLMLWKKSK